MSDFHAIALAGPTASGKSEWALELATRAPVEIISVDSAQVYRGFDVGAAKPDAVTQSRVRHHLIDIREPHEPYSAGEFVADALAAIDEIRARGRVPILVGGTMLYFNALIRGIAPLPTAHAAIRALIDARAASRGWAALHEELARVDPEAAARIHPNDPQRIQRALEVYEASGRPISAWQRETRPQVALRLSRHALVPEDRDWLHARIATRFRTMMDEGFLEEVRELRRRPELSAGAASLRAVGYRQLWGHLAGESGLEEAVQKGIVASRQLAKRQLTWINGDPGWQRWNPLDGRAHERWVDALVSVCQRAE